MRSSILVLLTLAASALAIPTLNSDIDTDVTNTVNDILTNDVDDTDLDPLEEFDTDPIDTTNPKDHAQWHAAGEPVPNDFHGWDDEPITLRTYTKFNQSCSGHRPFSKHKLTPFKCKSFGTHDRFTEVQFTLPKKVKELGLECVIDFFNGTKCDWSKHTGHLTNKHERPFCNNTVGNLWHRRSALPKCWYPN